MSGDGLPPGMRCVCGAEWKPPAGHILVREQDVGGCMSAIAVAQHHHQEAGNALTRVLNVVAAIQGAGRLAGGSLHEQRVPGEIAPARAAVAKRKLRKGPGRKEKQAGDKAMIISALLRHHRFSEGGDNANLATEPATQKALAAVLDWGQYRVSRVLGRCFPEGFWDRYKLACKGDTLAGFLKALDEESGEVEAVYHRPMHPTPMEERASEKYR